ncbi:hypothetical protein SCHPADRAFT_925107 [Schizopora paradoxa]|uniref:Uncharacterized protein n=1 Tax=Schizopora paradoxa TaxID=27342 RepID=A0A0H2S3A3_9AGAM|nr:hypothetical protein SCHPADRAFT_925107 [Schizopora paradoxa]
MHREREKRVNISRGRGIAIEEGTKTHQHTVDHLDVLERPEAPPFQPQPMLWDASGVVIASTSMMAENFLEALREQVFRHLQASGFIPIELTETETGAFKRMEIVMVVDGRGQRRSSLDERSSAIGIVRNDITTSIRDHPLALSTPCSLLSTIIMHHPPLRLSISSSFLRLIFNSRPLLQPTFAPLRVLHPHRTPLVVNSGSPPLRDSTSSRIDRAHPCSSVLINR